MVQFILEFIINFNAMLNLLQVVKQCCATDGVEPQYIKEDVLPHFFKHFWNHRMALDRRNYRQVCLSNIVAFLLTDFFNSFFFFSPLNSQINMFPQQSECNSFFFVCEERRDVGVTFPRQTKMSATKGLF